MISAIKRPIRISLQELIPYMLMNYTPSSQIPVTQMLGSPAEARDNSYVTAVNHTLKGKDGLCWNQQSLQSPISQTQEHQVRKALSNKHGLPFPESPSIHRTDKEHPGGYGSGRKVANLPLSFVLLSNQPIPRGKGWPQMSGCTKKPGPISRK